MIEVDRFLNRVPGPAYKCFDFVRDVWRETFSEDIGQRLQGLSRAAEKRRALPGEVKGFRRLLEASSPCFVVFQRPRSVPHIGIWYEGRVLHLQGGASAQYSRLKDIARRYKKVSFWL